EHALAMATEGRQTPPSFMDKWRYLTNPLPRAEEGRIFDSLRRELSLADSIAWAHNDDIDKIGIALRDEIENDFGELISHHNPFIRHIIMRTRTFLEEKINPETKIPYLPK